MPAKATCAALKAPSAVNGRPSEDTSSAAVRSGVAVRGTAPHKTQLWCPETAAGTTGASGRIAPFVPRVPLGAQSAGSSGPQPAGLQSPSTPSQIAAAATMPLQQRLPPQLRAAASRRGHSARQRPNPSSARINGSPAAARPRSSHNCRYCALHGVVTAASPTHRATCQYFNRCPCFKCRKLHLRNSINAELNVRHRTEVAARKAAAKRKTTRVP